MMKLFLLGLTALCLMLPCGCSRPAPRIEVVRQTPPAVLLAPVPEPVPPAQGATNSELLDYSIALQTALGEANNDKKALRGLYKDAYAGSRLPELP